MTNNIIEPVDGAVFAYSVSAHEGLVYVTVSGPDDDRPMIIVFDLADLDTLKDARRDLKRGVEAIQQRAAPTSGVTT